MNNLSVIKEVITEPGVKDVTGGANQSQDSGLAESDIASTSGASGKIAGEVDIIIPFQALNTGVENVKESTFLGKEKEMKEGCDLSNISPENAAKTLNSSDGEFFLECSVEDFENKKQKVALNDTLDFSESFDDDFLSGGKAPNAESEKRTVATQVSIENDSDKDESVEETTFETTSKDDGITDTRNEGNVVKKRELGLAEILPKLPKMRNGMVILGVHEQSPLVDCGELFKCRIFRPDKPLKTSEVFEDGTSVRFTNLTRLMSDDFTITRFKVELATYKVGVAESDMVGIRATPGIFEIEDFGNLTIRPFIERKTRGKYNARDLKNKYNF